MPTPTVLNSLKAPYLLFIGDAPAPVNAKTANGVADFAADKCLGYCKLPEAKITMAGLPELSIEQARAQGANTLVIGLANSGGYIAEAWVPAIIEAIHAGLDIASGLHQTLESIEAIAEAAERQGVALHNVRHTHMTLPTGSGRSRTGKRLLAVGTDCSVGKMYTILVLHRALLAVGRKAHFVATGQTGIFIAGHGISIDNVAADFMSGAVELMTPDIPEDELYIIEGQGSLFHPSFAGISLALLHGAAADYLVLCHDPAREHMRHLPDYLLPDLAHCMATNLQMAQLTNPNARFVAICCNTQAMSEPQSKAYLAELEQQFQLPATDPYRFGVDQVLSAIE